MSIEGSPRSYTDEELAEMAGARTGPLKSERLAQQAGLRVTMLSDELLAEQAARRVDANVVGDNVVPQAIDATVDLPGEVVVGGRQEGVREGVVEADPTTRTELSSVLRENKKSFRKKLRHEIRSQRARFDSTITSWKALAGDEAVQKVANYAEIALRYIERNLDERPDPERTLFIKTADRLAQVINADIVPNIDPITKTWLATALKSRGVPPPIVLLASKVFGEIASRRLETKLGTAAVQIPELARQFQNQLSLGPKENEILESLMRSATKYARRKLDKQKGKAGVVQGSENAPGQPAEAATETSVGADGEGVVAGDVDAQESGGSDTVPVDEGIDRQMYETGDGTGSGGGGGGSAEGVNSSSEPVDPEARNPLDPEVPVIPNTPGGGTGSGDGGGGELPPGGGESAEDEGNAVERVEYESHQNIGEFDERYDITSRVEGRRYSLETRYLNAKNQLVRDLRERGLWKDNMMDGDYEIIRKNFPLTDVHKAVLELDDSQIKAKAVNDAINEAREDHFRNKKVYKVDLSDGVHYYINYDSRDKSECELYGSHSKSIVVQLALGDLLGNFSPTEISMIRSFDARYLYPEGIPDRFVARFEKIASAGNETAIAAEYESYKKTLMRVMYMLIADKVQESADESTPTKLAGTIKQRLKELKALAKNPDYANKAALDQNFSINRSVLLPPPDQLKIDRHTGRMVRGRYSERAKLADIIGDDLIPALEKIEYSVSWANRFRSDAHNASVTMEQIGAKIASFDMSNVPEAVGQNEYLGLAMQEYIKAVAQVAAETNHIAESNFFTINPATDMERAEELTVQAIMLRMPPEVPFTKNVSVLIDRALADIPEENRFAWIQAKLAGYNQVHASLAHPMWIHDLETAEKQRQKRYEKDIEIAVKIASGLHKGPGEFWSVLHASMVEQRTSTTPDGQERVRNFQDNNKSGVAKHIAELRINSHLQYGKNDGMGFFAVTTSRYVGDSPEPGFMTADGVRRTDSSWESRYDQLGDEPAQHGKIYQGFVSLGAPDIYKALFDAKRSARQGGGQLTMQPADESQQYYLVENKHILEAPRKGMTPDLDQRMRERVGFLELTQKIPGDIPRSAGWRVENDEGFDKYIAAFTVVAEREGQTGVALHESVMTKLRQLGGERLVVHYINKKVDDLMKLDNEFAALMNEHADLITRLKDSMKSGKYATYGGDTPPDDEKLQALLPVLNRARDQARVKYVKGYVMDNLLQNKPYMALLFEQKGTTPVGEKPLREQLATELRAGSPLRFFNQGLTDEEIRYAVMYKCMPSFEVLARVKYESGDVDDERLKAYLGDVLNSSPTTEILSGTGVEIRGLKSILVGNDDDQKLDVLTSMYRDYISILERSVREDQNLERLSTRFSEHVVYGVGKADSLLTSGAGFDYSRIQFYGGSTVESAVGGIKDMMALNDIVKNIEKELHTLYHEGNDYNSDTLDSKAGSLVGHMGALADKMSGNPIEAQTFFVRLAQVAVLSIRKTTFGTQVPTIWSAGNENRSGTGLSEEKCYMLFMQILAKRKVPDRLCSPDKDRMQEPPVGAPVFAEAANVLGGKAGGGLNPLGKWAIQRAGVGSSGMRTEMVTKAMADKPFASVADGVKRKVEAALKS